MADAAIVDEIAALYEAAAPETDLERLTQLLSKINSPKAAESLLSLAGDVSTLPQNDLQKAALRALAGIGDAQSVSYLLRKLEAAPPGEGTYLFDAIAQIKSPGAQAPLLYAAAGNKEVSAESGRTAAIYALENYPNEQTCALLANIIAQEDNTAVATAAIRTLENIQNKSAEGTAKVDAAMSAESPVPLPVAEK
jgi:HEAT repeat protein